MGHEPNALTVPTRPDVVISPEYPPAFCYEKYASLLGLKIENDEVKVDLCLAVEDVSTLELQDTEAYPGAGVRMPHENPTPKRLNFVQDGSGYVFLQRGTMLEMYAPDGVFIDNYTLEAPPELEGMVLEMDPIQIEETTGAVNGYPVIAQDGFLSINGVYNYDWKRFGYVLSYSASGFGTRSHFTTHPSPTDPAKALIYSPEADAMLPFTGFNSITAMAKHGGKFYLSTGGFYGGFITVYNGDFASENDGAWTRKTGTYRAGIVGIIDYAGEVYTVAADCADEAYWSVWGSGSWNVRYAPTSLKCYDSANNQVWSLTLRNRGTLYHAGFQFERITTDGTGHIYLWYRDKVEKRVLLTGALVKDIQYPPHILGYLIQSYKSSMTGKSIINPDRVLIQDTRAVQAWSSVNRVQTNIPYLHVSSITGQLVQDASRPGWYKVIYWVQMIFSNGTLGSGCTVEADLVGTEAGRVSANTDASGIATFETGFIKSGHQCATRLAVMSAYQSGVSKYNYREAENMITELTAYVP